MRTRLMISLLIALVAFAAACSDADITRITATVAADEEPADGLGPGDPVAAGVLRLYVGNDLILETVLDSRGSADIGVEPGIYTVQVMAPSSGPGCFWGATVAEIALPGEPLSVDAFYICSG